MLGRVDIVAALRQPLQALVDPGERIFWPFLLVAVVMPLVVLGPRGGWASLVKGLFARRIWAHASSRTDINLVFAKAVIFAFVRLPWLAGTAAASLWIAIELSTLLGPADLPAWDRTAIAVVYTVVLFVAWDASRFALHWLMHRVPTLWAFHQVHHSAEVLTPLTLYRTHPVETILYDLRGLVTTAAVTGVFLWAFRGRAIELQLLGINALGLLLNALGSNLRHSHVWLRFGRLERWILSPAQHQLHHGRAIEHQQSNYGTWLAVWDRAMGTWRAAPETPVADVGLDDANHRFDRVRSILIAPFGAALSSLLGRARQRRWSVAAMLGAHVGSPSAASAEPPAEAQPEPPAEAQPEPPAEAQPEPPAEAQPEPPAEAQPEADPGAEDEVDFELELDPEPSPPAKPGGEPEPDAPAAPAPSPTAPDPGADVMVDTISIIGTPETQATVGGSAYVIDEEELDRKENDDVHRVLRSVPGVYTRDEDGFGLRPNIGMRGVSSDRSAKVTLMEDGILLGPAPYSAPAAYYFPIMTRIVGVEVFKGPSSIKHGPQTVGGSINLQTRPIPRTMQAEIDAGAGMRGYGKLHGWWGATSKERLGVVVEGVHVRSNGFKELDGGGNTGFAKSELMLKGRWSSDPNRRFYHQLDVKTGFGAEESHETYLGLTDADFEANPYRRYAASGKGRMKWWRTQGEVGWFVARGTIFDLHLRGYRHDFHRAWRKFNTFRGADIHDVIAAPDVGQTAVFYQILSGQADSVTPGQSLLIGTNDRRFAVTGGSLVAHVRPTWRWLEQDIEVGVRVHHDEIRRNHTEDGHLMVSGTLVPDGTPTATTTRNRGQALAAAFHAIDTVRIKWFSVMPGARVEVIRTAMEDFLADDVTAATNTVFIPGIGAHAQALPWLGFLAGVHSGFSPVAPGQPEGTKPERSIDYEAGARIDHATRITRTRVDAIGFFNDYSNLTSQCTFSSGCDDTMLDRQFNAGRVFVYGAEARVSEALAFRHGYWLEAGASYTYTGSRFRSSFTSQNPQLGDVEAGDELPYVPEHLLAVDLAGGGRIWGLRAQGSFVDDMRDVAGQGPIPAAQRIPRYFVLDAGADVWPTPRTRIYLSIQNLLNTPYMVSRRPYGARPGMPFQLMVGLKYHFG